MLCISPRDKDPPIAVLEQVACEQLLAGLDGVERAIVQGLREDLLRYFAAILAWLVSVTILIIKIFFFQTKCETMSRWGFVGLTGYLWLSVGWIVPCHAAQSESRVSFIPQLYTYSEIAQRLSVGDDRVSCARTLRNRAAFVCLRNRSWQQATELLAAALSVRFRPDERDPNHWWMEENPQQARQERRWRETLAAAIQAEADGLLTIADYLLRFAEQEGTDSAHQQLRAFMEQVYRQVDGTGNQDAIATGEQAARIVAFILEVQNNPLYQFALKQVASSRGRQTVERLLNSGLIDEEPIARYLPSWREGAKLSESELAYGLALTLAYWEGHYVWLGTGSVPSRSVVSLFRQAVLKGRVLQPFPARLFWQEMCPLSDMRAKLLAQYPSAQQAEWMLAEVRTFTQSHQHLYFTCLSGVYLLTAEKGLTPVLTFYLPPHRVMWRRLLPLLGEAYERRRSQQEQMTEVFLKTAAAQLPVHGLPSYLPTFWEFVQRWCEAHQREAIGEYFFDVNYRTILPNPVPRGLNWVTVLAHCRGNPQDPLPLLLEERDGVLLIYHPLAFLFHRVDYPLADLIALWRSMDSWVGAPLELAVSWEQLQRYFRTASTALNAACLLPFDASYERGMLPCAEPLYRVLNSLPEGIRQSLWLRGGRVDWRQATLNRAFFTRLLQQFGVREAYHPDFADWLLTAEVVVRLYPASKPDQVQLSVALEQGNVRILLGELTIVKERGQ